MLDTDVIKKPWVTEKSTFAMNEANRYSFIVDRRARKDDIRRAVEAIYDVKVESVATKIRKGKLRRTRFGMFRETPTKVATVRLRDGDAIELF